MSSKIQGNVWDACAAHNITGAKLLIMARLADYSNDEGISYPSVDTICRQLGLGKSTVCTALSWLEAEGWLFRESRRRGNRNTSNLYRLNAERLEKMARAERDRIMALKEQWKNRTERSDFDGSDFERSDFDGSDSERSDFDGSDSGRSAVLTVQNLNPDPSVNSTEDPKDLTNPARDDVANKNNSQQQNSATAPSVARVSHPLPDDFAPDDSHRTIADERGADFAAELANFRDYHLSRGASLCDWGAAFRVWLRNARPQNAGRRNARTRQQGLPEPAAPNMVIPFGFRGGVDGSDSGRSDFGGDGTAQQPSSPPQPPGKTMAQRMHDVCHGTIENTR